jgi:GNAT superfamily N-acetyltransferase
MTVRIEPLTGTALHQAIPDLARLRIEVFRDWPYLYDGTLDHEQSYIRRFSESAGAVIVVAVDGDVTVGAATAAPLAGQSPDITAPFQTRGYDVSSIFYFGESVLKNEYRGRGIGHAFFDQREAHARAHPGVTHATFCAVQRPDTHATKPAHARPLDAFWRKRGYRPVDGLTASFSWLDVGAAASTAKPMQFWMKAL